MENDDEIKVRIAIAVDHNGKYCATAYTGMTDDNAFEFILDNLEDCEARYFVDVTLRKPKLAVLMAGVDSITKV